VCCPFEPGRGTVELIFNAGMVGLVVGLVIALLD
jgi:hypothetical protein